MPPSTFCPKNGRRNSRPMPQSSRPKTKSRTFCDFSLLSFSASASIASPDNSSSTDTENSLEMAFRESILGNPRPDSHLETAVRDTYKRSAKASCVSPFSFLSSCSFSLNSIKAPPSLSHLVFLIIPSAHFNCNAKQEKPGMHQHSGFLQYPQFMPGWRP